MEIKATQISFSDKNFDHISWSSSPNGLFGLKNAHKLASLEKGDNNSGMFEGEWIWKVATIPKIQYFLWKCLHQNIPVHEVLSTRGMDVPQTCPICNEGPETILHCLRNYREAQALWKAFPPLLAKNLFFGTNLVNWLKLNCQSTKILSSLSFSWGIIFPFGIWTLWLRRNNSLFRNTSQLRNLRDEVLSRATKFAHLGINGKQARS